MTFLELTEQILKVEKRPLTATEIWTIAEAKGYDKKLNSEGKTPWASLGAQIYVNAKDNPKTLFAQTDSRPKKFYLKSQATQIDLADIETVEIATPTIRETINKLTMNTDFKEFISTVKIDITSKKIHKKEYDIIQEPEKLKINND